MFEFIQPEGFAIQQQEDLPLPCNHEILPYKKQITEV